MAFEKLFQTIKIGTVEIKNRYAYAPTNLFLNWQGYVNEQEIAYYTARAMGGTGLIIVGAYLSTKIGVPYANHPFIYVHDVTHAPGLADVAENIRLAGAVSFVQLLPFPSSGGRNWTGIQPAAPSPGIKPRWMGELRTQTEQLIEERMPNSWFYQNLGARAPSIKSREITVDEIQTIIKEHAFACKLAAYAGFEGIEHHMCHIYLVDEFRDPLINKRTDRYGGSEENRNRLLLELVEAGTRAAKEENPDIVVGVRVGSRGADGGYTFEETKRLALQLQEMGMDYYHVTFGFGMPQEQQVDGRFLDYSKELKKILKIPVMTPAVHEPEMAEKAVAEGWTDMVSGAMRLIVDPEFVNKVKENRLKDIIKCPTPPCPVCSTSRLVPGIRRCVLNPEVGREQYNPKYQIWKGFSQHPALRRKKGR